MSGYREFRFYSPALDAEAARLSLTDAHGREFYAIVPVDNGRRWRERRDAALDAVAEAIDRGEDAGEVVL